MRFIAIYFSLLKDISASYVAIGYKLMHFATQCCTSIAFPLGTCYHPTETIYEILQHSAYVYITDKGKKYFMKCS